MDEIRLFVCSHKELPLPSAAPFCPIQVGAALAERPFPGFLRDDAGDNISAKNRSYCELTAQYWAWKNDRAPWLGFFHYRRFLYPEAAARRPYRIEAAPTPETLERLGFSGLAALAERYDAILPIPEEMFVSVREHYAAAPHHRAADLRLAEEILKELRPEYAEAAERYLSGTRQLFGNLFIMRRAVFEDYCAWLFPILEEFDRRADWAGRSPQELRADGYLAERLLGVYAEEHRGRWRSLELPRVHFDAIEGKPDWKNRLLYALLPPSSRRRSLVKRLMKKD